MDGVGVVMRGVIGDFIRRVGLHGIIRNRNGIEASFDEDAPRHGASQHILLCVAMVHWWN